MAQKKKTARRVPSSADPRMYGDGRPAQLSQPASGGTQPASQAGSKPGTARAGSAPRGEAPLSQEYGYVPGDLKRLGIIAGTIFAAMVVLGIIVH